MTLGPSLFNTMTEKAMNLKILNQCCFTKTDNLSYQLYNVLALD